MDQLPILKSKLRFQRLVKSQLDTTENTHLLTQIPLFYVDTQIKQEKQNASQLDLKEQIKKPIKLKIQQSNQFKSTTPRFQVKNDNPGPYFLSRDIKQTANKFNQEKRFTKVPKSSDFTLFEFQKDQMGAIFNKAGLANWRGELKKWTNSIIQNVGREQQEKQEVIYFQSNERIQ